MTLYFREGLHTSTLPNPLELSIKYVQIELCIFRNTKLPFKEKNIAIKVKCVWDCFVKLWWLSDFNDHDDAFCNYEKIQYFIDENHC